MGHKNISRVQFVLMASLTFVLFTPLIKVKGQTVPVGLPVMEDAYRRGQLLGKTSPSASFTSRPFFPFAIEASGYYNEPLDTTFSPKKLAGFDGHGSKPLISLLPVTWLQQYNTDRPEGINNGAMIPARGYQTLLTGGVYARWKWFSLQLKPELVYAQNRDFDGFSARHPDNIWKSYYAHILRFIDLPERFGESAYQKAFWGQSSLRFTYKSYSLGLSNENLWWGPGMQNAILMTNNAPGFRHLTFNTVSPVKTPLGSFEWQLIGGKLESSGFPNIDPQRLLQHGVVYKEKPGDWRYLNGIILSYQPRWFPGLFLGASRSFIIYKKDMGNGLNDYLPVFIPMTKKALDQETEDKKMRDQRASVFMRWVAPEAHMEIYAEYGREDHNYHLTDLILQPDHIRAYIAGFRKLIPTGKRPGQYLDFRTEIAQFAKNVASSIRAPGASGWYNHGYVVHGYTHLGQILGAGIGTSSNMQSFSISWVKELKRVGLEFKRLAHEENFWAVVFKDYRTHWVDLGGAIVGEWAYNNLIFNARFETIGALNYQFYYHPVSTNDPPLWWDTGKPRYNMHTQIGVTWCF